jgi:hypothetical protein
MQQSAAFLEESQHEGIISIDEVAPDRTFRDVISITVHAAPAAILDAAYRVTADDMPVARALGTLRYLPGRLRGRPPPADDSTRPFIPSLLAAGTVVLRRTERELLLGSAGKYHQLTDQEPEPFATVNDFYAFNHPDYQKLVMSLRVEPTPTPGFNRLVLEHRTQPLGEASRRAFRRYWYVIKPAGAFVTRQLLLAIRRRAEAA